MRRAAFFFLGLLAVLVNCSTAKGQGCGTTLQPEFSVYNSVSRDGTTIYTAVTMEGYANVNPGPGCNMSVATHHVGAENKLNNVDHWTYSANGCPTRYFSATDNEQIVGEPGVEYPWAWDGVAICSIVGTFFGSGSGGSLPGCLTPSNEYTAAVGVYNTSETTFTQTIYDSAGDSFSGQSVQESNAAPAVDTCWFQGSSFAKVTGVSGGTWTVSGGNTWGYDGVGWIPDSVPYYRTNAPKHGIGIPCGFTMYQQMQISCPSGNWVTYTPSSGNKLTGTIDSTDVENCRYDIYNYACKTISY